MRWNVKRKIVAFTETFVNDKTLEARAAAILKTIINNNEIGYIRFPINGLPFYQSADTYNLSQAGPADSNTTLVLKVQLCNRKR